MASQEEIYQLRPSHVLVFPFMAQGHTLPLLHLSKALSRRRIEVTVITTPANASSILPYVAKHPSVHLKEIPFPCVEAEGIPRGCENTAHLPSMHLLPSFLQATKSLQNPFDRLLQEMSEADCLPICVISDFFLGWTLASCRAFGIPRLVFHGMGVLSMAISKTVWENTPHLKAASDSEPLHMPGLKLPFTLTRADLSNVFSAPNHDDPFSRFVSETGEADVESWGVIVNSFVELERPHVASLESFYRNGAKAWCVGPLGLYNQVVEVDEGEDIIKATRSMEWLAEQAVPGSVIYAAFGTQADVSDAQLDEVVEGLEMSGYSFLLVVRSSTWKPCDEAEERRGLIVREWVDQPRILAHRATGGFLSHCGWNSVTESLSAGVPILAWPMIADQSLNAKLVVDGFGAGAWVPTAKQQGIVGREAIRDGVRELMEGDKASSARERAQALGRAARRAVQKEGSSHDTLTSLIHNLRHN